MTSERPAGADPGELAEQGRLFDTLDRLGPVQAATAIGTLGAHLDARGSLKDAAARLRLHPNTVNYRIRSIVVTELLAPLRAPLGSRPAREGSCMRFSLRGGVNGRVGRRSGAEDYGTACRALKAGWAGGGCGSGPWGVAWRRCGGRVRGG
ncbi:helix-turn-helix domain-containing protein [Actinomadura chokoriensis]|uniref:helix-turn-helix domain-containing protein n=1 Tax=Actinomadura chokoriensis TaxID=454156 RepID=UPI003D155363